MSPSNACKYASYTSSLPTRYKRSNASQKLSKLTSPATSASDISVVPNKLTPITAYIKKITNNNKPIFHNHGIEYTSVQNNNFKVFALFTSVKILPTRNNLTILYPISTPMTIIPIHATITIIQ